jgi:hypothetical protein
LGASVLVVATMYPAAATDDDHDDGDGDLLLVVCKHIDNDDEDEEFDITAETDDDDDEATLGDGDCEKFKLAFDDNTVTVSEDVDLDDWNVEFKTYGDVEDTWENDDEVEIEFDDGEDDPRVVVIVENEADDNHDADDDYVGDLR